MASKYLCQCGATVRTNLYEGTLSGCSFPRSLPMFQTS